MVIARYVMGHDVPSGLEVTLKPNEACVVIEDGRIAGVATQQHMEVNPQIGLLGRMFGKSAPNRSFLFAYLGPHDLVFEVNMTATNGEALRAAYSMRVNFTRETIAKVLHLPARGAMEITAATLVELLQAEVHTLAVAQFSTRSPEELRTGKDLSYDLDRLASSLRASLEHHGLRHQSSFITWEPSKAEALLRLRREYEHRVSAQEIVNAREQNDMELELARVVREAELSAGAKYAEATAVTRAEGKLAVERLRVKGQLEDVELDQAMSADERKTDYRREQELKEAEHQREMARLKAETDNIKGANEREREAERHRVAMEHFKMVQDAKKERMAIKVEQEIRRLSGLKDGAAMTIEALAKVADTADDPMVKQTALDRIAEMGKANFDANRDAYNNSD
tara:strand:- start:51 stop:1241 length:1191 start_codon:yes stop_codon:yes gene_type:complete